MNLKTTLHLILLSLLIFLPALLKAQGTVLGQTIQINTFLHSYVGKPAWTLIIRDIDNGQNIPYLYDFRRGTNFWIALTYGRNYLITASRLDFSPYRRNPYRSKRINNFCNLESNGHISRGVSLYITIKGDLSPNPNTISCEVLRYPDTHFIVVDQDD